MVGYSENLELERLEKQVEEGGGGVVEYLSLVRKLKVRRSSIVAKHGLELLNKSSGRSKLGSDRKFSNTLVNSVLLCARIVEEIDSEQVWIGPWPCSRSQ